MGLGRGCKGKAEGEGGFNQSWIALSVLQGCLNIGPDCMIKVLIAYLHESFFDVNVTLWCPMTPTLN